MTPHDERLVSEVIEAVGKLARRRIRGLPKHTQDLAWTTVAAAIVGAAINDSSEPYKVVSMVFSVFVALVPSEDLLKVGGMLQADVEAARKARS